MNNNLTLPNNNLIKASYSNKYSNYTLFNRRQRDYSQVNPKNKSKINTLMQRPYSTSIKLIPKRNVKKFNNKLDNQNNLNIFSDNQSTMISKNDSKSKSSLSKRIQVEDYFHKKDKSKTSQANVLESILNLEKYYTPNSSFNNKLQKSNGNLNINTNIYFNDLKYINRLYLTETTTKKPLFKKEDSIFNNFNNEDNSECIYKDFSKKQNADILSKFRNDKTNYDYCEVLKTEYNERIIKTKNNRINLCRAKKEEFMEKARNEKLDKLSFNSKKELCKRIKETYQNKVEYLDDRIQSFESWKKLNKDFFENKIGDYLKFLMYKKAYEKNKVEDLIEEIIQIKKESNAILSKMAKIQSEKSRILRWVYFQIKLKEKKIELPKHYKLILENINVIEIYYEKKAKKEKNIENIQNNININYSISSSPSSKRQKRNIKKTIIVPNADKEDSNFNLSSELVAFLNKKEGKSEFLRIKEYKNNLIYKNAEEFNDRLLSIEKEDLRLIEYNDFIKEKIFWLKKELDKVIKEKNKIINIYNYNLQINLNELNHLKKRYSAMNGIIQNLELNKKIYKEKIKKRYKSASHFSKNNKIKIANKKILYMKIIKIFNLCKLIKFKSQKDYEILDEKRKIFKKNETVFYFVYIEYVVNYLLREMNEFINNHKDGEKAIKKILFDIERSHRMKKAEAMRRQIKEKYVKLEYEINKKNNKIYLLPYRKVRDVMKTKKEKLKIKDKSEEQPKFEDFIDDEYNNDNDENDCYFNEEEKNI